jgi:multidrug efflux pump subunit AcrB
MSRFSIRNPHFIIVVCLIITVIGLTSVVRMPVDLFPAINIPQVVVATFYSGMPPEQIETDITGRFERFFTLGAGIDHMESRSLPGTSIIKVFFQPGTDADSDVNSPRRSCATSASSPSAISSRVFPAPRCRRRSAASIGKSWSTSIPSGCRPTR